MLLVLAALPVQAAEPIRLQVIPYQASYFDNNDLNQSGDNKGNGCRVDAVKRIGILVYRYRLTRQLKYSEEYD